MKKSLKIVSVLMIAMMMVMVATPVFATNKISATNTIGSVENKISFSGDETVITKVGKILGFLQWAGIVAGVVILTIFGIKYMMGSLEEKAEYKKTMIPFVVGAVVVMLAPQLAKLIFNIFA